MGRTQSTKRTAIKKKALRKKVAPKLVSTRPKRDQSTSDNSQEIVPISDESTATTQDANNTLIVTATRILPALADQTQTAVPLPTLPEELEGDGIITPPLQLPPALADQTQAVPLPTLPEELEQNGIITPPLQLPPALADQTQAVPLPTLPEERNGIITPPLQLPDTDVFVGDLFTDERTGMTTEQADNDIEHISSADRNAPPTVAVDKEAAAVSQETGDDGGRESRSVSVFSTGEATFGEGTVVERSEVVASGDAKTRVKASPRKRKV